MAATAVQTVLNGILVWQSVRTAMQTGHTGKPDSVPLEGV